MTRRGSVQPRWRRGRQRRPRHHVKGRIAGAESDSPVLSQGPSGGGMRNENGREETRRAQEPRRRGRVSAVGRAAVGGASANRAPSARS